MLGIANSSFGGLINDTGANFIYEWNEFFTSTRPSTVGLTYGTPEVLAPNVLDFSDNLQFSSVSGVSTPSDFVDGKLALDITAKPGQGINALTLFERGTYGFGLGGTSTTAAKVQFIGAVLTVTSIDGLPVSPSDFSMSMTFNVPSPNSVGSKTFFQTMGPDSGDWAGTSTIDLATLFPGKRITGAKLVFDNQLETVAGTSTHSFIDKKDLRISIDPYVTVPEPASIILLSMGALLFVFTRSRKNVAR
jgi:hypothetical protein